MKLQYIALLMIAIGFYNYSIKDYINDKKNREFIEENLEIGTNVITNSGIIGEVIEIKDDIITLATGNHENFSYINIAKKDIKNIIN